jgi:hypothetical protein
MRILNIATWITCGILMLSCSKKSPVPAEKNQSTIVEGHGSGNGGGGIVYHGNLYFLDFFLAGIFMDRDESKDIENNLLIKRSKFFSYNDLSYGKKRDLVSLGMSPLTLDGFFGALEQSGESKVAVALINSLKSMKLNLKYDGPLSYADDTFPFINPLDDFPQIAKRYGADVDVVPDATLKMEPMHGLGMTIHESAGIELDKKNALLTLEERKESGEKLREFTACIFIKALDLPENVPCKELQYYL